MDNCAQYAYGNARFQAMADAVNRTGRSILISTEPFSLVPTPIQGEFSHMYRTTNDVEACAFLRSVAVRSRAWWLTMPRAFPVPLSFHLLAGGALIAYHWHTL